MSNKSKSSNGGLGCSSVVQIVLIVLKLLGLIDWSWWWVLSPTLVGLVVGVIFFVVAFVAYTRA